MREMACVDCNWVGSEDDVEWALNGRDYDQDEEPVCPICMGQVRWAKYWVVVYANGDNIYRGTLCLEGDDLEQVAVKAETLSVGGGHPIDILGPIDYHITSAI